VPEATCALAPLDHLWVVSRVLSRVRPSLLVLIETELWPVMIGAARRRGVPIVIASGRLSLGSLSRYRRWRFLFQPAVHCIDRIGARSRVDAERFVSLGARTGRVEVVGDLKLEPPAAPPDLAEELRAALGHRRWLVAGSTHLGEEGAALDALEHCERHGVAVGLVLAPRHLSRIEEVEREVRRRGRAVRRRSALGGEPLASREVLLLDSYGDLAAVYGKASLAFVGGTLAPIGGHDLLEPLQAGVAVCFGPSVANVEAAAELVVKSGAGRAVMKADELAECVLDLLSDPKLAERVAAAQVLIERYRGGVERCLAMIDAVALTPIGDAPGARTSTSLRPVPVARRSRDETRVRAWLRAPLLPLAWLYGAGAALHRGLYARGILRRRRLPCRVISVGSVMVGGSGKTPAAIWLARGLQQRGHRVVLATRGYLGKPEQPGERVRVLSDGFRLMARPAEAGDEPMLLARHAPGVPVVVCRDRGAAGLRAVSAFDADVVVLDDGFQHHRLARDLEIVVFDAAEGLDNGHVLPRGPLRERASVLAEIDAVGVLGGAACEMPQEILSRCPERVFCFGGARVPTRLRPLAGGDGEPPSFLRGRKVGVLAGIARPESLIATLEALGAEVIGRRFLRDHHRYSPADLRGLGRIADLWITTEKDAVKILPSWLGSLDLRVLEIELRIDEGDALLDFVESQIDPGRTL
jgi:3-deoxy-D-manno-octulosonic-acid transferase